MHLIYIYILPNTVRTFDNKIRVVVVLKGHLFTAGTSINRVRSSATGDIKSDISSVDSSEIKVSVSLKEILSRRIQKAM